MGLVADGGDKDAISGIDLFKFLMAIVVVIIHTIQIQGHPGVGGAFLDLLRELPVPYFFIASGYLVFLKIPANSTAPEVYRKLRGVIVSFIKLYLCWKLIYLPVEIIGYRNGSDSLIQCIRSYFELLFFYGMNFYSWQLWYLLSIIYGLILVRLLIYKTNLLVFVSILLFVISISLDWVMVSKAPAYYDHPVLLFLRENFIYQRIPSSVIYLVIGVFLARGWLRPSIIGVLIVLLISLVLVILRLPIITQFAPLFISTILFWLSCNLKLRPSTVWARLRKASSVIYFSHMLVLYLVAIRLFGLPGYSKRTFIVVICFSALISLPVIALGGRFKWLRIFGK